MRKKQKAKTEKKKHHINIICAEGHEKINIIIRLFIEGLRKTCSGFNALLVLVYKMYKSRTYHQILLKTNITVD